jgi:hypothetical protein
LRLKSVQISQNSTCLTIKHRRLVQRIPYSLQQGKVA